MLDREHRKAATRIAAVHAAASLALGVLVGGMWLSAIFAAVVFIAIVVIVKDAGKGTSRLRAGITATAVGIFVFWPWAGIRVFTFLDWPAWLGFVIGIICSSAGMLYGWWKFHLRRPSKRRRPTNQQIGMAAAILALVIGTIGAVIGANQSTNGQFAGPVTTDIGNGQTVEVRYASFDEPLVGDGANVASVPVLNDGKGLVTSWGNLYDRTMVLAPASKANVIANADRWNNSTRQMYPDKAWMWFPSWSDIENTLRHLTGEYRVIALINTDMPDAEATRLIRERHPELPANLPVIRVKGALINSECGNGDCNNTPSPAQQFIDANGMVRVMLTNPFLDNKSSGQYQVNISAAEYGIGLGTECWNGFLGARALSPEVKQTLTSKAATGGGTTSVTTTAVLTTTTVTPSSSTTTKVTTTTPTGSTTTVTTTTPTSTTTTVTTTTPTTTTTNTTTTNTTTNTTTTNTTTSTTPPLTTSKNPEDDPENQGNNQEGHGGQNDTPDPTDSNPAGGTPPTSYTAPATAEPTTTVRPTEAIPSNQGQPSNEPVPADPTDDTPACDPAICGGPGLIEDTSPSPVHAAEAAPTSSAPVVVEEEAAPPAATHSESAPAQAPVVITSSAPAAVQPQQSQAPVAPSSASQEKVSSSSVSAGDIDNTASSQETGNNSGIILIAIIGTGGLGIIGGSALYLRRRPREGKHYAR